MNHFVSEHLIKMLNERIKKEEESARLYLAMSNWLNYKGYLGAAKLWKKYSEEEMEHAEWSREFLLKMDIKPETPSLEEPVCEFESFKDIIIQTYDHEVDVTKQCQELAKNAMAEHSYMVFDLAMKYIKEQVEELDKTQTLIDRLEAFGDDPIALRLLDNELGNI